MTLQRIKRLRSHAGHARYLATLGGVVGWIPRIPSIPSPYAYSPAWQVLEDPDHGPVLVRETATRSTTCSRFPRRGSRRPRTRRSGRPLERELKRWRAKAAS